jgi:molecular chaperone GrpE
MSEQDAADTDGSGAGEPTEAAGGVEEDGNGEETDANEPEERDPGLAEAVGAAVPDENDEVAAVPSPGDVDVEPELLEQVEAASPEETARCIALLRRRVDALEGQLGSREQEIEDLESRLKRKQADFQNYKKRQKERLEEEKRRATEDFVERIVDVRDNLARALDQDGDADIRGGVETTLTQFDEQLQRENVERLEPDPGEEVDPQRHETLATVASDQPEGTVAEVHRPGYEMACKVVRPAQVAVSDGSGAGGDDAADGS